MDLLNNNWDSKRIKNLFEERVEKNVNSQNDYLSIVKDVGVIPYSEKGNVGNKTSDNPENYKRVYPNDLVINPMNVTIGSVGVSNHYGCLSNVYMVLKPKIEFHPQYYGYMFRIKSFQKSLRKISYGIMEIRESINKIEFFGLELPYPPLSEQQQIVSFLNTKTSLIDSLIEKTQQKIELLEEKRTSIINEVVTKGLNPNVEMKDSGVEWIGEIPFHWTYGQVRRFTTDHRQGYYSSDGYTNSGHRVVRITDLKNNNKIDVSDSPYYEMSEVDKDRYELKKGDFLFQRTGSHKKIGVFSSNEPSVYGSFLIRFRFSKKINHEYLRFFFNSSNYKNQLNQQIHGGVNPNIHVENIKECYTTSPPLNEQQQIVEYLDEQTQLIDNTISIEEKRIELLKEYRQSLISEIVTGKRKVVEDNHPIIKNSLSVTLPYKILNPQYEKKVIKTSSGETITTQTGEEYLKPKKELIDFLNKELSNLVTTKNQKDSIEKFFKESFFRLKHSLPSKGHYEHTSWNILKGKDGSILSNYYFTSGIMDDMKPNWERFIFKLNGEIDEFTDNIYEDNFIEKFRIYR